MTWFSVQVALHGVITRGQPHHMHLTSLELAWSRAALGPAALAPSGCLLEMQALGLPETHRIRLCTVTGSPAAGMHIRA